MAQVAQAAHENTLGYVCHELRNPLHVLQTWFGVLLSTGESGPLAALGLDEDACQDIAHALNHMNCVVNDVLDYRAVRVFVCVVSCRLCCG